MFFGLSLGGFWEATRAQRRPRTALRRSKTAVRRPKTRPRGTKIASRCVQDVAETAEEALRSQGRLREAWDRGNTGKTKENMVFSFPVKKVLGAQGAPGWLSDATRRTREALGLA